MHAVAGVLLSLGLVLLLLAWRLALFLVVMAALAAVLLGISLLARAAGRLLRHSHQ